MAYIEGIGDEVVLVVGGFILVVILLLAWYSTQVRERARPDVVVLDGTRIAQAIQRIRTATAASLTQTPIGYIIRPRTQAARATTTTTTPPANQTETQSPTPPENDGGNAAAPTETQNEEVSVLYAELLPNQCPSNRAGERESTETTNQENTAGTETTTISPATNQQTEESAQHTTTSQPSPSETSSNTESNTTSSPNSVRRRRVEFFTQNRSTVDDRPQPTTSEPSASADIKDEQATREDTSSTNTSTPDTNREDTNSTNTAQTDSTSSSSNSGSSTQSGHEAESEATHRVDGHIRIRLKYLDERQRFVQARPDSTIVQFKRIFFESELSENMTVRLIYNGQVLVGTRTLQSYQVEDNSVIHCVLSQGTAPGQDSRNNVAPGISFDMGTLVFPLFGLILGVIWYCRIMYRTYFNAMSTFSLVGISFLFLLALMSSFRRRDNHEHIN